MDSCKLKDRVRKVFESIEETIDHYGPEAVDLAVWVQTPDDNTLMTTQSTLDDLLESIVTFDKDEEH